MRHRAVLHAVLVSAIVTLACGQPEPQKAPAPAPPPPDPIAMLTTGLASGQLEVVDLAQPLSAATPIIHLPPQFANTPGFQSHQISNYDKKGPAWYWNWFSTGEHVGTHFDAPCHWVTGKDKGCVDQVAAAQFIGAAVVLDVTAAVAKSADFIATRETILAWEQQHGHVPKNAWVILHSGWGSRAADTKTFLNVGPDGAPHYPGFGKDSAEFLTTERDVLGVGTEAVGTDAAVGAGATPPFPNHSIMHGAGKFGLTQLANVDKLPAAGAVIIATPLKIEHGSGSPVRVIAIKTRS